MNPNQDILVMVLGRRCSLFADAVAAVHPALSDAVAGARVLVIGAGGSIGSAFVKVLAPYRPAALHLVDLSENALVRLVRDLHADGLLGTRDFYTYAIGFDEPEFGAFLRDRGPFDYILNFAALKHVRSERDPYTLMRLLRVNVLANHQLQACLVEHSPRRFFCVSSDKAVNPASLMGASKAFMERVCLAQADAVSFSSARFANVAFSEGSLLQSFLQRLEAGQPLAGPSDVRRYFISHQEAGELCLLSCFTGHNREIFTPALTSATDLKRFPDLAGLILGARGLKPRFCQSEAEAVERARARKANDHEWPCFFAPSDTPGEKPFEEFQGVSETADCGRLPSITVITQPTVAAPEAIDQALQRLEARRSACTWSKAELAELVRLVVPELTHVELPSNLDQKL